MSTYITGTKFFVNHAGNGCMVGVEIPAEWHNITSSISREAFLTVQESLHLSLTGHRGPAVDIYEVPKTFEIHRGMGNLEVKTSGKFLDEQGKAAFFDLVDAGEMGLGRKEEDFNVYYPLSSQPSQLKSLKYELKISTRETNRHSNILLHEDGFERQQREVSFAWWNTRKRKQLAAIQTLCTPQRPPEHTIYALQKYRQAMLEIYQIKEVLWAIGKDLVLNDFHLVTSVSQAGDSYTLWIDGCDVQRLSQYQKMLKLYCVHFGVLALTGVMVSLERGKITLSI